MQKILKLLFSKKLLSLFLLLLQIYLLAAGFLWFEEDIAYLYWVQLAFCTAMVIYEVNSRKNPAFQMSWLILVALAPAFALLLYVLVRTDFTSRRIGRRVDRILKSTNRHLPQDPLTMEQLCREHPRTASLCRYLEEGCGFPVYQNTDVKYYPLGDFMFEDLKRDLMDAERFIFLEFFMIYHGIMWSAIHEILKKKSQEGVEVRLLYDGMGCRLSMLPGDYYKQLEEEGISCRVFSPVLPLLSTAQNNRDHRKIVVVDGKVAYTGGVNLGDEYINREERFGHWKDTAVRLCGDGVDSFSMLFLQMWNAASQKEVFHETEYLSYLSGATCREVQPAEGYVVPYGDCPLDQEATGERVYLDLLNTAQRFVHITTPYLVPSSEMRETMLFTAKRGVEVVLLLPHIPDKRYMRCLAHTYYPELIRGGVKIYEYLPGFVHAKMSIADGERAVVGTINHDFRSLFLHYECAALLIGTPCIQQIEQDFQQTLKLSHRVTLADYMKINVISRIFGYVLRLFAPLL